MVRSVWSRDHIDGTRLVQHERIPSRVVSNRDWTGRWKTEREAEREGPQKIARVRDVTPKSTGAELRFATSGPGDNETDERAREFRFHGDPKSEWNSTRGILNDPPVRISDGERFENF